MISDEEQRVFITVDGVAVPTDYTASLNDFRGSTEIFTLLSTGYIYIAQELPFAHKYFDVTTGNTNSAVMSVEIWNGTSWESAIDIRDSTAALTKSGYLKFKPDYDEQGWQTDETGTSDGIPELTNIPKIKCMYWARLSVSADLTAVTLNYIGQKLSDDDELYSRYPGLNNQKIRDAYEQGTAAGTKTDWEEQEFIAAEFMIRDLKTRNVIIAEGQIVDTDLLNVPSIHKTAQIIFGGLDRRGSEDESKALARYEKSMSLGRLNIDQDGDGDLSERDKVISTGFARR